MNKRTNIKDFARRATMALLLLLVTTTAWATYTCLENSQDPIGHLEIVEGEAGCFHVVGWTCDPYQFKMRNNSSSYSVDPSGMISTIVGYHVYNDSWWTGSDRLWDDVYYWAKENQVEIHLQQNGEDKYVYTYEMNDKRRI